MDDRRQDHRIPIVFRSDLSSAKVSRWQGTVVDISARGCRLRSEQPIQVNDSFSLQLFLPQLSWPVQIEQARVKWVQGQECGCQFITVLPEERTRLLEGLAQLERERGESESI